MRKNYKNKVRKTPFLYTSICHPLNEHEGRERKGERELRERGKGKGVEDRVRKS